MTDTAPSTTSLARLARWLGLDRNPLRRRSDRVESSIMAALLAAFLIGAPITVIAVGHLAHAGALRAQHGQQAWHRVPAILLDTAPKGASFMNQSATFTWVRARWTAPDGSVRVGEVPAAAGTRAGSTVHVWAGRTGVVARTPLTATQIVGRVAAAATFAPIALGVLLLSMGALARRLLERRSLTRWEAAWEAIEPQWSHRG